MKLRTKSMLFFGALLLALSGVVIFYAQYIVGGLFKAQSINNFSIIAEQSEGAYLVFLQGLKIHVSDWSSDANIQNITKALLDTREGSPSRVRAEKSFAEYLSKNKMPYNKAVFLVDLIDREGKIIASTNSERIGKDEKKEKIKNGGPAHDLLEAINASFGMVYLSGLVYEEDEYSKPVIHAVTRIFYQSEGKGFVPLDAVMIIHFSNTTDIAAAFGVGDTSHTGRQTGNLLFENYKTSDIYIVNNERVMVTPSRNVPDITQKQKVDTLPVRECFENGKEVSTEYDNYRGKRVFGATMCFKEEGTVIVVEVEKDEIFAPVTTLVRGTGYGGVVVFIIGAFAVSFFMRRPLQRIMHTAEIARMIAHGDYSARTSVTGKDEIAEFAQVFNTMIETVEKAQIELQEANTQIQKEAFQLEQDVEEHKRQEKFLEESKRAQLNLLEDAWQVKEKLEAEGRRLQTILSSIGDGLILIDGAYRVALANTIIATMFGMSREEILGRDLRTFITLWKKRAEIIPPAQWPIEEVFLTKKVIEATLDDDLSISTEKHPVKLPIVFSVAPLGGNTAGAVIVMRDATKDRELDDAKSGFISVASHQLRTPLTTIRWYAEMLLSGDVGEPSPEQRDFLNEIHGGAERLYQTIDLLLGISRVESGKMKVENTEINLNVFTDEIKKELAPQVEEKKLMFTINPPSGEPLVVVLDRLTLRQVLLNLVSNAVRYTNENGSIEIKWWRDNNKNEVVYAVHDNGIGIPEAQRSRIFSKFFRAENALAKVPDGSGLGLALVKELVMSWGGRVWFETTEGNGTTFYFTIPLVTKVSLP